MTEVEETRAATRATVSELAVEAFGAHALTEVRPWLWVCRRPNTWMYGFYVAVLPGCVVVMGDVGDGIFRMSEGSEAAVVGWLRGAVGSWDYLLGKLTQRQETFYPGDVLAYLRQRADEARGDDPGGAGGRRHERLRDWLNDVEQYARGGDLHAHSWAELVNQHGGDTDDYGVGTGHAASAFWLAEALAAFVRLLEAWRPIDDAPRDGQRLRFRLASGAELEGSWFPYEGWRDAEAKPVAPTEWRLL